MTAMDWPSRLMCAVRAAPVLAVKLKFTTPPLMLPRVSQPESLVGANGASRFSVAGRTTGRASAPAAKASLKAVGSTNARGSSLTALL